MAERKGNTMNQPKKQEEKQPVPWEMKDPKPPVIRSGRMEQRKVN